MSELAPNQVRVGAWVWTKWPTMPLPTHEWIVQLAQSKGGSAVDAFHRKREEYIARASHDPGTFGWEAPPIQAARALLNGKYVPGAFGPVLVPEYQKSEVGGQGSEGGVNGEGKPLPACDDLLLMTGNRFGKSTFGGRFTNDTLNGTNNARVRCWSQSLETSRSIQQAEVFKHLRPNLRKIRRVGQFTKISYSGGTGFTEETLLFQQPLTAYAQCWFLTYHSWQQDKTIAEGVAVHLTWCDEEVPAELLDTLRYRVGSEGRMILLVTFTPITGYTDAVGQYIENARIVECVPARRVEYDWWTSTWKYGDWLLPQDKVLVEGCPPGHLPLVLEHIKVPGRYTICAGTGWNPFIPLDELLKKAANQSLEVKMIRWFGWPTRKVRPALAFMDAHLVPPGKVPPLESLTIYLMIDPCPPPRNWFMLWVGVDRENRIWVLGEWPDIEIGEWAVPGTEPDGKPGPGAFDGNVTGFDGYKLLVLEREGWTEEQRFPPFQTGTWQPGPRFFKVRDGDRYLDPRAASWKVPSKSDEEATSYIECLLEPVTRQREGRRVKIAAGLDCQRAPSCSIQEGNELINDWLTQGWNAREPINAMNCPRFYINAGSHGETHPRPLPGGEAGTQGGEKGSEIHPLLRAGCQNTIWALRTFTGRKRSGAKDEDSACKDPIDCLKGLAKVGIRYIAPGALGTQGGGHSY